MLDLLLLKKALMSAMIRKVIDLIPSFHAEDPQIIKNEYEELITRLEAKFNLPISEDRRRKEKGTLPLEQKLSDLARWYTYRAQMLWGRPAMRDRFRSAWLYVVAARLYEHADLRKQASDSYHFAASAFREVQAYRASMDYYIRSSELASGEWVARCLHRALGVALTAGDLDEQSRIRKKLEELSPRNLPQHGQHA